MKEINSYVMAMNIIFSKWHYLLVSLTGALIGGYLFLCFTTPDYRTDASLKVEERKSELSELINIRNLYDRTSKMESEKTIICSRNVLINAIATLNYKISYYKRNHFSLSTTYPDKPLKIQILQQSKYNFEPTMFKLEPVTSKEFNLTYTLFKKKIVKRFQYGKTIHLNGVHFIINKGSLALEDSVCFFKFNRPDDLIKMLRKSLRITDNQNTNILELSYTDSNPYFSRDILNAILKEYQQYDRLQRSTSNEQTTLFIDTLLQKMSTVLKTAGTKIERFKSTHQMLSLSSSMEELLQQLTTLETEKHGLTIRQLTSLHIKKTLAANFRLQKLNNELQGIEDPQLLTLLAKMNELLEKRTQALVFHQPISPFILYMDKRIEETKQAMADNVENQLREEKGLLTHINEQIEKIKYNIRLIPKTEKDYINLQSDFNVQQKVYNYLSEKKLETQISTAAVVSRIQIIDDAVLPLEPIYPIKANIYTDFGLAGILLGILSIFIKRKLNPYLYDISTVEMLTSIPIIGFIRNHQLTSTTANIPATENPRSLFSESIRNLRANLNFISSEESSKIICITSEIAGEGKSFCAVNLAGVLSLINKRVVIIAADLRKSALHKTFKVNNQYGLSSYLADQHTLEQICISTDTDHLFFIPSGPIPPNPSELLQSDKMQQLLLQLKSSFDYIILDSAPVGLVSDAIPLMKLADVNLFMLRYGVSRRHSAALPQKLQHEVHLNHLYLVMNSFEKNRSQVSYYHSVPEERYHNDYYSA